MTTDPTDDGLTRREFSAGVAGGALSLWAGGIAVADRLQVTSGVAAGDVTTTSAVLWSRCDRPARMVVELSAHEDFRDSRTVLGPSALEVSDFTAKLSLGGLPPGEPLFYRVRFQDLSDLRTFSEPVDGRLRTAPTTRRDVTFAWSGDTAGQGFGIDLARGGMTTYETIRRMRPDFLVHSGDTVYADNPFPAEIPLADGTVWRNVTTEETSKVAETLAEFRANHRYNLLDENVRRLNAEVPLLVQWDDHEVLNNWYPGEILTDDRYTVKSVSLLAARAKRAFFEYQPLAEHPRDRERIYRSVAYGPHLELFLIDMRSYRGPNTGNRQEQPGDETALLGREQLRWLKRKLRESTATWKVVCSDMPIGLVVPDGPDAFEAVANGDGPPLGRELEIADLLSTMKRDRVRNTVWLTADVHYAASHFYDPQRARFADFDPFWEFVSGPLHAGTFGPNRLDDTFGPQVRYQSVPEGMLPNRPPSEGQQFFGMVRVDGDSGVMTVTHFDVAGTKLWTTDLEPVK